MRAGPAIDGARRRGRRRARAVATILLALAAASGCQAPLLAPTAGTGFFMPVAELLAQVRTVCLVEPVAEIELGEAAEKMAALEAILSEELAVQGFDVIGSEAVDALRDRVAREAGGYFDPKWGHVITERRAAIEARFHAAAAEELGCDAVASSRVVEVEAAYWRGAAHWDHAHWRPGYPLVGYVPALSFLLTLRDGAQSDLYFGAGGIQVAVEGGSDPDTDYELERLDPESLLSDAFQNRRGVRLALSELAREREWLMR